eukprot:TRINITY_DN820_c0_g2_i1.p1 TRINITY_DN820_c0_g2~~TRINITY_DN820_c0_g2_i1.p1  ORF type:complete len:272 (+),score=4.22 TRINITY_DN820_c0_g2_i1:221-1036(+)
MTSGTHIETFMQNVKKADTVVIFLNDAYLRSRNCMYEFLRVWDEKNKKLSSKVFVIRHPEFNSIFGGSNASIPYANYWDEVFQSLKNTDLPAASMAWNLKEQKFSYKIYINMTSIIEHLNSYIQVDYEQIRSKGFEDILRLNLGEDTLIPHIALGNEEIYRKFLKGTLIYKPEKESEVGRIDLAISALRNPLDGTFDLSQCGDAGKYLSISTGYRKKKKSENSGKIEIWITPRFLIKKELVTTAKKYEDIMEKWKFNAHVGPFWTWVDGMI